MEKQPFDPGLTQSYGGRLVRIVNKDGSFNVHRRGTRLKDFHFYKFLVGLSWPQFIAISRGCGACRGRSMNWRNSTSHGRG